MSQRPGPTPFAERLRRVREQAGLTQRELASRIGVRQDVLSRVERGEYVGATQTVVAAARVLGIDEEEMLRLAQDARDPVVAAIAKSDKIDEGAKRELLDRYRQLVGESLPGSPPLLVSASEAARLLSVTQATVKQLIADGELELVHLSPRHQRVSVRSLEAFVARRAEQTAARLRGGDAAS